MENNKKIKIISMDFDGTLLTSDKRVSDRTRECLMRLRNSSYVIIGVTARNFCSVKETLDIELFDYIVLNNGSDIFYVKENRVKSINCIDLKTTKEIYNLYADVSAEIDFCTPYNYIIKSKERYDARSFIKYINSFEELNDTVSRMNVFFNNDEEICNNLKLISQKFDNIVATRMIDTDKENSRKWITLNPKNVNKLSTLKILCKDLNCSIEDVIFFGDGENDLALIENAGIGVAMGNAVNIVKEKAKYITLSNDDDGIAIYLEENIC